MGPSLDQNLVRRPVGQIHHSDFSVVVIKLTKGNARAIWRQVPESVAGVCIESCHLGFFALQRIKGGENDSLWACLTQDAWSPPSNRTAEIRVPSRSRKPPLAWYLGRTGIPFHVKDELGRTTRNGNAHQPARVRQETAATLRPGQVENPVAVRAQLRVPLFFGWARDNLFGPPVLYALFKNIESAVPIGEKENCLAVA